MFRPLEILTLILVWESDDRKAHWISGELSQKKQERLVERASREPELLVNDPWKMPPLRRNR